MRLVGEVEDPEDGRVWQWEKVREAKGDMHLSM